MFLIVVGLSACGKKSNEQLAQTYFKMALMDVAESPDLIAGCKRALGDIDKALENAQEPEYYALKGTLLFKLGQYEQSEFIFNRALDITTDGVLKAEIMNNLACLWAHQGKNDKAAAVWESLKSDIFYKTPEVAMVNLGKLCAQKGDMSGADRSLHEAVMIAPSYIDAHYYRALVARQQGKSDVVKQECGIVLTLAPTHEGAQQLARMVV